MTKFLPKDGSRYQSKRAFLRLLSFMLHWRGTHVSELEYGRSGRRTGGKGAISDRCFANLVRATAQVVLFGCMNAVISAAVASSTTDHNCPAAIFRWPACGRMS